MGNENPQPTINMLRMGGVPDVKLLAVTARVRWTVVGQPLQFIKRIVFSVLYKLRVYTRLAQW